MRVLLREIEALGEAIPEIAKTDAVALELFYTSTRYPDSVNDGDPSDFVDVATARGAIERARRLYVFASAIVERARIAASGEHGLA